MKDLIQESMGRPVIAGHQPNFFPWFGYYEKMLKSDIFVYSDDRTFPKQSFTNRVEIPIKGSDLSYLTLPVAKSRSKTIIADKLYIKDPACLKKILQTITFNFGQLPYFRNLNLILLEFEESFFRYQTIADLNIHMNQLIASLIGITTPIKRGLELDLRDIHKNERLIERCLRLNSRHYLCGQGADMYQDPSVFKAHGIKLEHVHYDIGERVLGKDLKFSILYNIANLGIDTLRNAIEDFLLNKTSVAE